MRPAPSPWPNEPVQIDDIVALAVALDGAIRGGNRSAGSVYDM